MGRCMLHDNLSILKNQMFSTIMTVLNLEHNKIISIVTNIIVTKKEHLPLSNQNKCRKNLKSYIIIKLFVSLLFNYTIIEIRKIQGFENFIRHKTFNSAYSVFSYQTSRGRNLFCNLERTMSTYIRRTR